MATLDDNGVDEPLDASSPPIPADGGGEAAPPLPSPLEDDEVDIDMEQAAKSVCRQAETDGIKGLRPDEVFFVVQADLDYQEQNL
jgi:hypothetical protein